MRSTGCNSCSSAIFLGTSSCLTAVILRFLHAPMPPKIAGKTERRTKKLATVISPKQLRKLTKDGLRSLLTENKLSTTGTHPQLLQRLTKHMQSKRSPKRLQKATKHARMQAGSSTPRRHTPMEADSAHSGSEHSPTSARNSGSEPSGSDLFPLSVARSRPHTSVSPSGDHYHLPSGRHHSHRSVSPSGEHPRTPHLPSGRHHSHRGVSPSGEHPRTPHRSSRTHRSRRRHSNPRKRR